MLRLTVLLIVAFALFPGSALGAVSGWVTMTSQEGDYVGHRVPRTFDTAAGDVVTARVDGNGIGFRVRGGALGDAYELAFAAAPGTPLVPGVYTRAQDFWDDTRPGISISGDGRSCSSQEGSFEVRDLALAPDGSVQRAWLLYEQDCGNGAMLFGEARIGAPLTTALRTVPSVARFPAKDLGHPGDTIGVTVTRGRVTRAEVIGSSDFAVRDVECDQVCEVWVRFLPLTAGTRRGWLRLTDGLGRQTDVPLQGFAYGGESSLTLTSDPGEPLLNGATETWGQSAHYTLRGSSASPDVIVYEPDRTQLDLSFADREPLVAGRTYEAGTSGLPHIGLDVSCERSSGRFTVQELTASVDGPETLAVSFELYCNGFAQPLRGTLRRRAGASSERAPWMVSGAGATEIASAPGAVAPVVVPSPSPTPTPTPSVPGGSPDRRR